MIGLTIAQAATRVEADVATIEEWITCGWLIAIRNDIDGHRYIDLDRLLDVDRDVHRDGTSTVIHPGMLPLPDLAGWLTARGHTIAPRSLRHWLANGWLVAAKPGRSGPKGYPATYDPVKALAVAHWLQSLWGTPRRTA